MFSLSFDESASNRAVSPVIGIILMVAITVILAAVVGAFAFQLFDRDTNPAPSAVFETDYDGSDELSVTHQSGSDFRRANVEFTVSGGDGSVTVSSDWPSEVTSGESVTFTGVDRAETVRIVWQDPRANDQSQVLYEWVGPDA